MYRSMLCACVLLLTSALAVPAQAALVRYTATGVATGIGPTGGLVNTPFTAVAVADTASRTQCTNMGMPIPNCILVINNSLVFTVDGLSATLLAPSISIRNGFGAFVFAEVYATMPVAVRTLVVVNRDNANAAVREYDLESDLGPVSVNGLAQRTDLIPGPFGTHLPIGTSAGPVVLTSTTLFTSTFQAEVLRDVPAPGAWATMVAGLGLCGAVRRRTRRHPATCA